MTAHSKVTSGEHQLEDALRRLCHHMTLMQVRAAHFLPNGDPLKFIDEILELLDGPDQRRVQAAARKLLNEPQQVIPLPRLRPGGR